MKLYLLKHICLLPCLLLLLSLQGKAQGEDKKPGKKKENIAAQKAAFITQRLELTPEEAEKFWPVYNQYQEKLEELRKAHQQDRKKAKENFEGLSDKEVEALIDSEMEFKQKQLNIIKEMSTKLKTILPVKKLAKLFGAEEAFKKELLKRVKEQKK